MTDKLTADDMLRIMVDAVVRRLRDEAARREAGELARDPEEAEFGRLIDDGAKALGLVPANGQPELYKPDAPPPPADDLRVRYAAPVFDALHADRDKMRAAIEALRERVAALEDDMRDIAEYWNGSRTDGAMHDALEHIIEVASKHLAAGGANG